MAKQGINLPFGWDTLFFIITVVGGGIFAYAKFENKVSGLETRMEEANSKIESLMSKHIEEEQARYASMQEEISWYQKELNLNPLSWGKKDK
jgi:prefoldin subunit 5